MLNVNDKVDEKVYEEKKDDVDDDDKVGGKISNENYY